MSDKCDFEDDDGQWTERQRRFALALLRHGRPMRAYVEAGYDAKSPSTQAMHASKLQHIPHIARFLSAERRRQREAVRVDADRVVAEMAKVAFFNIADVTELDEDGMLRLKLDEASREQLAAVSELLIDEDTIPNPDYVPGEGMPRVLVTGRRIKMKTHGKLEALAQLARTLSLFADKLDVTVNLGDPAQILEARRRAIEGRAIDVTPEPATGTDG